MQATLVVVVLALGGLAACASGTDAEDGGGGGASSGTGATSAGGEGGGIGLGGTAGNGAGTSVGGTGGTGDGGAGGEGLAGAPGVGGLSGESGTGATGGEVGTGGASETGGTGGASETGGAGGTGGIGGTGGTTATGGTGGSGGALTLSTFVTYLGGNKFEQARDVAVDSQGNIIVVGGTQSPNFPVTAGSYDTTFATGGTALGSGGAMDAFVAKFDPSGKLLWATFVGGPNYDRAYGVEVDAAGDIYIGGRAGMGLPTTPGVLQPSFAGDNKAVGLYGPQDGFVAKLSKDGTKLLWATYFGGPGPEYLRDIALDAQGNVYAGLAAVSPNFPHITTGAFDTTHNGGQDNVVAKISKDGKQVLYASYIGGAGKEVAPSVKVNSAGELYVGSASDSSNLPVTASAYQKTRKGGFDYFVAKVAANGKSLIFCTYLGGSLDEISETHTLALDAQGNVVVGTLTSSTNFPTTASALKKTLSGASDAFVAKLSSNGATLLASTYIGGSSTDGIQGVAVDAAGNILVGGTTSSANLPVTPGAYKSQFGGLIDGWAARLSPNLSSVQYMTYLGSGGDDEGRSLWVDASGNAVSIGQTDSTALATTPGAFQPKFAGGKADAYVARFVIP